MREIRQQELEREFANILSNGENDIGLDNGDLQILLGDSENRRFLFGSAEFRGENAAYEAMMLIVEPLPYYPSNTVYIIHFKMHSNYPLIDFSDAIDVISETADEEAKFILGTATDDTLPEDYIKITLFCGCDSNSLVDVVC